MEVIKEKGSALINDAKSKRLTTLSASFSSNTAKHELGSFWTSRKELDNENRNAGPDGKRICSQLDQDL